MYRTPFSRNAFMDLGRLQREMQQALDGSSSIRGQSRGAFPAMNVGSSARALEIHAFAPGLDPASIEVFLDKGVLVISGERTAPTISEKSTVHIAERFAGPFRRVVSLPDNIDANAVEARYRDGVLYVTLQRREAPQSRRIVIQ